MNDRTAFRILPKENALFPEAAAPRQRTFLPPIGGRMGRPPRPTDLPPAKDESLSIDEFLPEEE